MRFAALICLLFASASAAVLEWDANPPTDAVTGYRLYWGNQPREYLPYDNVLNVGNVTSNVLMQATGRVYYAVTACNDQLTEGDFSDEVTYNWPIPSIPPSRPMNLRFTGTNNVVQIRLQQSDNLADGISWRDSGVAFVPVLGPMAFFRAGAPETAQLLLQPKAALRYDGSKRGKLK